MKSEAFWGALLSILVVFSVVGVVWAVSDQPYNRPEPLMDYVGQEISRYDSGYWTLQEEDCRACHGNSAAGRHHMTEWGVNGDCVHCHEGYPDNWFPPVRDCTTSGCHSWDGTTTQTTQRQVTAMYVTIQASSVRYSQVSVLMMIHQEI